MDLPKRSQHTTLWLISFSVGVVWCIGSAALWLGSSFKTVVEVGALILAAINASVNELRPSSESADKEQKWETVILRRLLQVNGFTKAATLVLFSAALAITSSAAYDSYRDLKMRDVEGLVVSATKQPINGALVNLLRNGQIEHTMTTTDGRFRFEKVDLRGLQIGQLVVEVQYKDIKSRTPVDFLNRKPNEMLITMPQGTPPFRLFYFDVDGMAIDFLMKGEIDVAWDKRLGGHPFLVPNHVYNEMSSLVRSFSEPMGAPFESNQENRARVEITGGATVDWMDFRRKNEGKMFFSGSPPSISWFRQATTADVASLNTSSDEWHLEIVPERLLDGTHGSVLFEPGSSSGMVRFNPAFFFWRFATGEDLRRFAGEHSLLMQQAGHSMPLEFAAVALIPANRPDQGGCEEEWLIAFVARPTKLRVVTLENTSSSPLRIGPASIREHSPQGLREFPADQAALRSTTSKLTTLIPQGILAPGEKIIVPLAVVLAAKEPAFGFGRTLPTAQRRDLRSQIQSVTHVELPSFPAPGAAHPHPVVLPSGVFDHYLTQENPDPAFGKVFVTGTSLMLDDIEVDGFVYPVRQYDPEVFAIWEGGGGVGSCPYIYAKSRGTDLWERQGHILYGFNSSHKESTDEISLADFDGTVLIREEDPEVSYIDQLFVREMTAEGKTRILLPDLSTLQDQDGQYVQLRRGESLLVHFPGFFPVSGSRYSVVAHGYYVPDWKRNQ